MNKGPSLFFCTLISGIVLLIVAIYIACNVTKKELIVDISPDNEYQLIISQVGDAVTFFSMQPCSLRLNKDNKKVSDTTVRIDTHREVIDKSYFRHEWHDTYVAVIVSNLGGRDVEDQVFKLYFNGDVVQEENVNEGIK